MILVDTSVWIDVLRDREGIVLKAFHEVVGVDLLPFLKEEEEVKYDWVPLIARLVQKSLRKFKGLQLILFSMNSPARK